MNRLLISLFCLFILTIQGFAMDNLNENSQLSIIPRPVEMKAKKGQFHLNAQTVIVADSQDERAQQVGLYLKDLIKPATGFDLKKEKSVTADMPENSIFLIIQKKDDKLGNEGYLLKVEQKRIVIKATDAAGLFYGVQTLRQLLPPAIESNSLVSDTEWLVPCVVVRDEPRFTWRGMHLDVCRHFMPVDFVKKYIDLLARYKFNRFHWHLTEDQGWRIEIKKYPKLSEISAWRSETLVGHSHTEPQEFDGTPHGGFYTQDEIKDVVAYAKSRFIEIVPEIEMPGHSVAALSAYPEISCTGGPFEVAKKWGIFEDVYCAGKEQTFRFLEDVLSEVIQLFPYEYIHIGGDECPKARWKECPDCQQRIKDEALENEAELQSYFVKRIEKFLRQKNRRIIGWDEILEGGLAPEATVMSWRGMKGGVEASRQGHDVIMTPNSHCYFDYYQANPDSEPLAIGGYLPLDTVYAFEPVPEDLTEKEARHILGAQGNVWTEYIKTPEHAEYMVMPRMLALSEVVWSPKKSRDWEHFIQRVKLHTVRLEKSDVNYSKSAVEHVSEKRD